MPQLRIGVAPQVRESTIEVGRLTLITCLGVESAEFAVRHREKPGIRVQPLVRRRRDVAFPEDARGVRPASALSRTRETGEDAHDTGRHGKPICSHVAPTKRTNGLQSATLCDGDLTLLVKTYCAHC
jgi:hypothetical protein